MSFRESLHRAWVEHLIEIDRSEYAALVVDGLLDFQTRHSYGEETFDSLTVYLPRSTYQIVNSNDSIKSILFDSFCFVAEGHVWQDMATFPVSYRMQLLDVEDNWRETIKSLIVINKELNQGLITEKAYSRQGKKPLIYNEMKFASKAEVRIAQELEAAKVLFFPLPLAIRCEKGNIFEDHREVDFLICDKGTWGILEVSYHPNRYEKDKEKDVWFKKSGILCIEHYPAERCSDNPKEVVDEFLSILIQYKK